LRWVERVKDLLSSSLDVSYYRALVIHVGYFPLAFEVHLLLDVTVDFLVLVPCEEGVNAYSLQRLRLGTLNTLQVGHLTLLLDVVL
jgi:hypothetical protein